MPLTSGLRGTAELLVADDDTAPRHGSGTVPVLATPRLVALCEEAAMHALDGHLPDDSTTVSMRVQFDHLAPTLAGVEVTAEACLEKVSGRRLIFTVSASDPRGLIAAGKVTRVVVDVDRFLDKAR